MRARRSDKENGEHSSYQERLVHQPSLTVESVLSASCEAMAFDIAEVWLRTGPKTHRLINSHLRPASLEDSVRNELVDVYYGERSSERTHRLSPALCKRAKEARDVVWVTASDGGKGEPLTENAQDDDVAETNKKSSDGAPNDTELLRSSISDVRTAVAVPVCHTSSNTNMTFLFFSMRRALAHPGAVEFLSHMSLSAAVASVHQFTEDIYDVNVDDRRRGSPAPTSSATNKNELVERRWSHSHHTPLSATYSPRYSNMQKQMILPENPARPVPNSFVPATTYSVPPSVQLHGSSAQHHHHQLSVTGAHLNLRWSALKNVEYLTDGGNSWIHTAVCNGRPVVVKTLKPECQDVALALNEIEAELEIHSKLDHPHIVGLHGAGLTSKGVRFVVLERLDGGTLAQVLGYEIRIRDRRRRFWRRRHHTFSYSESLTHARNLADALAYIQSEAFPGSMCLHRDLKPDNVGFTLDGRLKLIDFGLARLVANATPTTDDRYEMSGETGSLRYMAPEVADGRPYNHKADVYSFGVLFWEILSQKRPYDEMTRDNFHDKVVRGGARPAIPKRWPPALSKLVTDCWDMDMNKRPTFRQVVSRLNELIDNAGEGGKGRARAGGNATKKKSRGPVSRLIDRHSTWF